MRTGTMTPTPKKRGRPKTIEKVFQAKTPVAKRLLLRELLMQKKEIWVVNDGKNAKPSHNGKARGGDFVLKVESGDNANIPFVIPQGSDPICLSNFYDHETLAKCTDLFKALEKKALTLLDPDQAEAYYAQNEERRQIAHDKVEKIQNKEIEEITTPQPIQMSVGTSSSIRPSVLQTCLELKHGQIKAEAALETLKATKANLTTEDLTYVLVNGKDPTIKQWAKTALQALAA